MTVGELGMDSGLMGLEAIVFAALAILVFVMVAKASSSSALLDGSQVRLACAFGSRSAQIDGHRLPFPVSYRPNAMDEDPGGIGR